MAATVHVLHPKSQHVAGFLRIGHTGHNKLEALHAAGRLPFRRFIFDAAHIERQLDLLKALKEAGCEIVLDPNFAEMATVGGNSSSVKKLPWANSNGIWAANDFGQGSNSDPVRLIAEFAISHEVDAVLAPTHLIEESSSEWWDIDRWLCEGLRAELDRRGGSHIAIDYQHITSGAMLKDKVSRTRLMGIVRSLPVENLWLRVSNFGATATGVGTRAFIEAVRDFHSLALPIVADTAGGFAGLGAVAFGAAGGIGHGVGQKETFRSGDWKNASRGGSGLGTRIYLPEFDRHSTEEQLASIFAARGGKSKFGCNDTSCCPGGLEDMVENSHAHFLNQRSRQIERLSKVPEARRAEHFLLRELDPAVRAARSGAKLKIAEPNVAKVVTDAKARLVRMRDALADLQARDSDATRSRSPLFRGGAHNVSAVLGR